MTHLIIDTSSDISYMVLFEKEEILFFKKIERKNLSSTLVSSLGDILKKTSVDLKKIDYISLAIGPGSFTALRLGASVAKTLNYVNNTCLISYFSLQAYRPEKDGSFISCFDAKSEGVYIMEGKAENGNVFFENEPKLANNSEAIEYFERVDHIISPDEAIKNKFDTFNNKFIKGIFDPFLILDNAKKKIACKNFENYLSMSLLYLRGPNHIE